MNTCSFCAEILIKKENNLFQTLIKSFTNIPNRIIYETANWIVIPTLGAFVSGYVLVVSKKHYVSIGDCPSYYYYELECIVETIRKIFLREYKMPAIAFEHGAISEENNSGCCTTHTHLHLLPFEGDIMADIVNDGFTIKKIQSYNSLKKQIRSNKSYIYYQNNEGVKFLIEGQKVPSQYVRQIVADKLDIIERWDWKVHTELNNIINTISVFGALNLEEIYKETCKYITKMR